MTKFITKQVQKSKLEINQNFEAVFCRALPKDWILFYLFVLPNLITQDETHQKVQIYLQTT
jgi:hypothetical protein